MFLLSELDNLALTQELSDSYFPVGLTAFCLANERRTKH